MRKELVKGLIEVLQQKKAFYEEMVKQYEKRLKKSLEEKSDDGERAKVSENEYLLAFYQKKVLEVEEMIKEIRAESILARKNPEVVLPWTAVELSNGLKVFIVPYAGGEEVKGFNIISVNSPLYQRLKLKKKGEVVKLPNGEEARIERIA